MAVVLIVAFIVGAVPFTIGMIWVGLAMRNNGRRLPNERLPLVLIAVGFVLIAGSVSFGIATGAKLGA